jgi:hypothetical protein
MLDHVDANACMGFHNSGAHECLGFHSEMTGATVLCSSAFVLVISGEYHQTWLSSDYLGPTCNCELPLH